MKCTVQIAAGALKEIRALPADARKEVGIVIDKLGSDPRPVGARKIAAIPDCYRVRSGVYRIVYTVKDKVLSVSIVTVGHRSEVYRGLRDKIRRRT